LADADTAAAVESEPAEPQEPGAEQHVDRVVWQKGKPAVVGSPTYDERRGKGREARRHLDRHTAREVERAAVGKEAAAPDPVRHDRVDQRRPQRDEAEVGEEP